MPRVAEWLGWELTDGDCEMLAIQCVDPAHRSEEPGLYQTKWFDYRLMNGVKATYLFADKYVKAYRDCYRATRDVRKADLLHPFTPPDIFRSRELVAMWLARQGADALGVRYEFLLRYTMQRFADRGWRHFPRPNQLYAEELLLDVADAWKVECAAKLQFPESEVFRNENFCSHPVQCQWHEWICGQIKKRAMPHLGVAQTVFKEKLLPEQVALEVFGPGVLDKARHFAGLLK